MPHFVWTNDGTGKPIYMNKVAKKYFGKTEEEFDDWDWLDHFDIEEAREFEREWDMASQMRNPVQRVSRIKNYDGENGFLFENEDKSNVTTNVKLPEKSDEIGRAHV